MEKRITDIVEKIVAEKGVDSNMVIPILQSIQNVFNYLPEEALKHICEITDISLSQIYGVSSFYTQFRHDPVGKHIIKVCVGTACHVKGAERVYDAFKRELGIHKNKDTDSERKFTVEKVLCIGCCTLAPVIQIDEITYGYVTTEKIKEIIDDFLVEKDKPGGEKIKTLAENKKIQGEIRIGLGSCCVASGSAGVKEELENTLSNSNINVNVKQVGCVGVCNQVPLMEIHKPGSDPSLYVKIAPEDVKRVVHKHFKSDNFKGRIKSNFYNLFENIAFDSIPKTLKRYSPDKRDTPVGEFLDGQVNIATEYRGVIKPADLEEYKKLGGFNALRKCIIEYSPEKIISIIKDSGLRGRGGAGFLTGIKWELVKNEKSNKKYVICNGDEGDPGAFMDRMLLESYPFRIIEGILIAAYTSGAGEGLF